VLARWVEAVTRRPRIVTLSILGLAVAAASYTADHLRVDTDTTDMLSSELPFRRAQQRYQRAFPQHVNTLVVVIDGETPALARRASRALVARLARATDVVEAVYAPGVGDFFEEHALLYVDLDELEDLADRLAEVQPFLGELTRDPSLRGLFEAVTRALEAVREHDEEIDLGPILEELDAGVGTTLDGQPFRLSCTGCACGSRASPRSSTRSSRVSRVGPGSPRCSPPRWPCWRCGGASAPCAWWSRPWSRWSAGSSSPPASPRSWSAG
jgi:hypothetical protein